MAILRDVIRAEMPEAFHDGWNRLPGITVTGKEITIDPADYFFRFDNPTWLLCDWQNVERDLLGVHENVDEALEQIVLDYIKENGHTTSDPAEVLGTAWRVYSHLFRDEHLSDPAITALGITPEHLRMLTEMGAMMALNRVELDGDITNVGPAWMFPETCRLVYDINREDAELVDELYHSTWFTEGRRVEQVKAHAALGGRLVHGCQSSVNMAGGCVVAYGTSIAGFREALSSFRPEWIDKVRACGK